jgi:hypothetical protein
MGLGSEIRKKPIPDPGVKTAPDPGSASATLLRTVTIILRHPLGLDGLGHVWCSSLLLTAASYQPPHPPSGSPPAPHPRSPESTVLY